MTEKQIKEFVDKWGNHVVYGILNGDYVLLNPAHYLGKNWKKRYPGKKGGRLHIHKAIGKLTNLKPVLRLESTNIWVYIIHLKNI